MEVLADAYKNCGFKSFANIYELFPENLRREIIIKQKQLFSELWAKLSEEERHAISQYTFINENTDIDADPTPYEKRINDLKEGYETRKNERIAEVANLTPDIATSVLMDFEKSYQRLIEINTNLYNECKSKHNIIKRWEKESKIIYNPDK